MNLDDVVFYATGSNPRRMRVFVACDTFGVVGTAVADNLDCALDELADAGKLDSYLVSDHEFECHHEEAAQITAASRIFPE